LKSCAWTTVLLGDSDDADTARRVILDDFDVSLGTGLGRYTSRIFRIGHLGHLNDAALIGTLGSIELGLRRAGVSIRSAGVSAALDYLGPHQAGDV
jgi:alanine-glyoxylate transaminase/serine-glyoxylate transaminase/serine-pyruvate transaminase